MPRGKKIWADTGNAVWAMFTDYETRPTDFGDVDDPEATDPHLHTHAFCFAPTWFSEQARWQAAEFGAIVANRPYFEALYHARLAKAVEDLGYAVTPHAGRTVVGDTRSLPQID